jgi:Na+/proline symporter
MSVFLYLGMFFALTLVLAAGIYSGKKVSSSYDFSVGGRKVGYLFIAGTITGTLV